MNQTVCESELFPWVEDLTAEGKKESLIFYFFEGSHFTHKYCQDLSRDTPSLHSHAHARPAILRGRIAGQISTVLNWNFVELQ